MKIAFIGSGNMATGLGKHWASKGHQLVFTYSRDKEKLKKQAAAVDPEAKTDEIESAVRWANVVVLTTPYQAAPAALEAAGDLRGKVIWSIVNPLKPDYSGLEVGTTTSGAEELARLAEGARFVAALPPFAEALHAPTLPPNTSSVFVCSNDEAASQTVIKLVQDLGAHAVDGGPLLGARFFEPMMFSLVYLAYARKLGTNIGYRFLS